MDRVQLFEFEDLPWFPQVVRECMTDFLSFLGQRGKSVYAGFAERLAKAVQATGDDTLLDLCSGGGGPTLAIAGLLRDQYATPLRAADRPIPESTAARASARRGSGQRRVPHPARGCHGGPGLAARFSSDL